MYPRNPIKLHLNEHLSPRLAAELRRYGFDVTSTQELGAVSATDEEQSAHAAAEQRAILTFNVSDFVLLHNRYMVEKREHWGIIFSSGISLAGLLHRLLRMLNSVSAEELRNQVRWLNEFR